MSPAGPAAAPSANTAAAVDCGPARAALQGLDESWPHREHTYRGSTSAGLDAATFEAHELETIDRVPPDRLRTRVARLPSDSIAIGEHAYVLRADTWHHFFGYPPLPRHDELARLLEDCRERKEGKETWLDFTARVSPDVAAVGRLRLEAETAGLCSSTSQCRERPGPRWTARSSNTYRTSVSKPLSPRPSHLGFPSTAQASHWGTGRTP